jgi:plastocyanin
MRFSMRIAALAASVVALVMVATPALAARSHATGKAITVTATEFKFKLSATSAPHGAVTFTVVNKGKIPHDFKIDGKKTPLLLPGKSAKLSVTLKAGKNAYLCTVAGHASLGMKGVVTGK